MIVSYTEGRVRLRFKELQDRATAQTVEQYIKAIPGIVAVEIKTMTGSILIQYDPNVLPTPLLLEKGIAALNEHGINLELAPELLAAVQ